jgi:hypothetical protein
MGTGIGMRGKDLQKFLMVARDENVIILVRNTNEDSLKYIGRPGFYPKPAVCKAKTADTNPPLRPITYKGRRITRQYEVAGLVVHPGFHPTCYGAAKMPKAQDCWLHTMETLSPVAMHRDVKTDSWALWGREQPGVRAPDWSWRIEVNPESPHFGCLQLKGARTGGWCYIHGDYDLKDVIVMGHETDNRRAEGSLDGVKNFTPILYQREFSRIQKRLNELIEADMVQHGAEAQFAWHGDEAITVAFPTWEHLVLADAGTVQGWYLGLNREVIAKMGKDYRRDRSRMFHFGPAGMFAPGAVPAATWGA